MAYESVRSELAVMRRDLRWMAPVWIVVSIALSAWRAIEGDSPGRVAIVLAGMLGLGIAIVPVSWLRYRGFPQGRREVAVGVKVMGLVLAWGLVAGATVVGLVSLLEGN